MRRFGSVLIVAIGLSACGGGGGDDAATPSAREGGDAMLDVRDEAAEHKTKAAASFGPAEDGQDLSVGDTVRTNGTGFVEVAYRDGSLVRLDSDAEFTLTELVSTGEVQQVGGRLDAGRAWSNVRELTAPEGSYEIATPVATAAVRGTLFDVDCTAGDGSCTFTVAEGAITVSPRRGPSVELEAGDSLTVLPDGTARQNPTMTLARLEADPWIAKNLRIDEEETDRAPSGLPEEAEDEEAAGALEGSWTVTRTVTASTNPLQPVGEVSEVTYQFTRRCTATACAVRLDAAGTRGSSQQADLSFADGGFRGAITGQSPCRNDAGTELSVSPISGSISVTVSPGDPATFTGELAVTIGASPGCGERTTTFTLAGRKAP